MKTIGKILLLLALISLVAGCNKTDEFFTEDSIELKKAQVEVTVPFEVNLLGEITDFIFDDPECFNEGYAARAVVETIGTATHMGKVSFTFNFCTAGPPDPNIEGSIMTYAGLIGELVAANGDVLYLSYSGGSVIDGRKDEHPEHVSEYWGGSIEILGGTGRFEEAKGELTADDYGSKLDDLTHHRFFGKITLQKGKR